MPSAAAKRTVRGAREPVERRVEQRQQDLARAVGAEIGQHDPVAVPHARIAADHGRHDELVGLAARVGRLHRRQRASCARSPSASTSARQASATRSQRLSRSMA